MTDVNAVQEAAAETAAIAAPDVQATEAPTKTPSEVMQEVASELGWAPKEKWKGDIEDWRDADEFLRRTPQMVKAIKKQVEAANRLAADRIEKIQASARAEAEARIAAAVEAGDVEAAATAVADRDRATQAPDKEVINFAARNDWFNTNKAATRLAIDTAEEIANTGGTVAAQLEAAEKEVRKRFPELFEDEPEVKPTKAPPSVQGGVQRSTAPVAREKGWNDLPKHIQNGMTPKHLKSFGLTQDEYAKSWFKENA